MHSTLAPLTISRVEGFAGRWLKETVGRGSSSKVSVYQNHTHAPRGKPHADIDLNCTGPVKSLRRLFALKWFMGSRHIDNLLGNRHIDNLTVIPEHGLQGHVIALFLASGDPHTVYDLVVDTRPHIIEVDKGGE
jgi:hypothetical protein